MTPAWLSSWPGARKDEPLSRHTHFGVGGPADWWVPVGDVASLRRLVARCHADGIPITVLGEGSNTLVLDRGIRGVVVSLTERSLRCRNHVVELSGGYTMPRAALDTARLGLAGLEFGIGIPGSCGASIRGNAGAFGQEIADVLVDCDVVDLEGRVETLTAAECGFAYRHSVFKAERQGAIVVAARLRVEPDEPRAVKARIAQITAQRKATQPWGVRSLGSVFKNPPGDHAGRLLEAAGLKGLRIGGAQVSEKHANFVLNIDRATAAEVLSVVRRAKDTVAERFGIDLELEIVVLGEPGPEQADDPWLAQVLAPSVARAPW